MLRWLSSLPMLVMLMAVSALAMLLPSIQAAVTQDWYVARVFF